MWIAKTQIVPCHGPLGTQADLQLFHDVLVDANEKVTKLIQQGKTLDELLPRNRQKYITLNGEMAL